jgi:hypothetical protein
MANLAPTRMLKLLPALVLVALVLPSAAFGQATRTWVSGVGDDVNPCSRTAPCKTFAGAISKTAPGGIINAMDDGGFGALTITKAITVDGGHHTAGVLASGGINAINVSAGAADRVVLRNLDIEGNGTTLGLNGVQFNSGLSLKIQRSQISVFSRSGVLDVSSTSNSRLVVEDSYIYDNGGPGVTDAPPNGGIHKVTVRDNDINDNGCGVAVASFGMSNIFGTECGTNAAGASVATLAKVLVMHNGMSDNAGSGVLARGAAAAVRIGLNQITGSSNGIRAVDSASLLSFGNNLISGNSVDGTPTGTTLPSTKAVAP